jgi:hypothetical protein
VFARRSYGTRASAASHALLAAARHPAPNRVSPSAYVHARDRIIDVVPALQTSSQAWQVARLRTQ